MSGSGVENGFFMSPVLKTGLYIDPLARDILVDPTTIPLIVDELQAPFAKLTPNHGRSLIDLAGTAIKMGAEVKDENGDVFTAFNIKGSLFGDLSIGFSDIEPNQLRTNGALDVSLNTRCKKASKVLRAAGALVEWPLFSARPKAFPNPYFNEIAAIDPTAADYICESVGLNGLRYLLAQTLEANTEELQEYLDFSNNEYIKEQCRIELRQNRSALEGLSVVEYGVMYRGVLSNYRLSDLRLLTDAQQQDVIADAILALQKRKPDHMSTYSDIALLQPNNPEHREKYMNVVLPRLIGENLGILHNSLTYHRYLHKGNISVAGEIVDLDSVSGKGVYAYEEVPTIYERLRDLQFVMYDYPKPTGIDHTDVIHEILEGYITARYADDSCSTLEGAMLDALFIGNSTIEERQKLIKECFSVVYSHNDLPQLELLTLYFSAKCSGQYKEKNEFVSAITDYMRPAVAHIVECVVKESGEQISYNDTTDLIWHELTVVMFRLFKKLNDLIKEMHVQPQFAQAMQKTVSKKISAEYAPFLNA